MDAHDRDRIEDAKDQLRSAILFGNWKDARQALETLEEIAEHAAMPSAFTAARGACEFCPDEGGGCCVCGGGRN